MATRRQRKLVEETEGDQEGSSGSEAETEPGPVSEMAYKYKLEMKRLEMEREVKQREFEERQKEREQEMELKRMEFELQKQRLALSQTSSDIQEGRSGVDTPDLIKRFPKFTKDDDVEKFLISFERCCKDFGVAKEKWMIYLRPQITGRLLQIYGDLPEGSYGDYDLFKKQILQEFRLTPEFYRFKFRTLKRDKTQSFAQVASKLSQLFDSWLRTSEVEDYQQLRELLKLEQFFQLVPYDIRWVIQDRKPSTIVEAAVMVDQIITLKEGFKREDLPSDKRTNRQPFYQQQTHPQQEKGSDIENTTWRRQGVTSQTAPEGKRRCFQCGKWDHIKYQCPLLR
ncbi:uncharacterized protein, partial [Anolis sagrei]|uniref:uncharacterized protein n=1 Tax=Anolis sagrei TaxID=38937 RepID=UPI0035206480